ncbi:MAG TPA: cupin domain-containing protein [Chthoniobacter sp.]|nr:cupin domain-containing protein [Chthoniobacter sp.]
MNLANLQQSTEFFEVMQTTERSQTAVMTLALGGASSSEPNIHPKSDQVVLLVDGELTAKIGEETRCIRVGDIVIVPAGTPHKFTNSGKAEAKAFSIYAPPAYPAKKK